MTIEQSLVTKHPQINQLISQEPFFLAESRLWAAG